MQHASFTFAKDTPDYTHKDLFKGPYPVNPVIKALEKTVDFFDFLKPEAPGVMMDRIAKKPELEKQLLDQQQNIAKDIIKNSIESYESMREGLRINGPNTSFKDKFLSTVDYLILKLRSDNGIIERLTLDPLLWHFRDKALAQLNDVKNRDCPYMDTIEAIERALEFYDVYHRTIDPKHSPILYHSGRYQYYLHFLKGAIHDHIFFPTMANLGATDLLKIRGVGIGFAGVNTEINYVDGYYQTPFEFYIHDVNHVRRMFLFFEKASKKLGFDMEKFARMSDKFVRDTLLPMISINSADSEEVKNIKRLKKILFFEVLHEDALAAHPDILQEAVLRSAGVLTPFERIDNGNKVTYVMEPGASTLAYVFRKLTHDFYDMPGDRFNNVVDPKYRTYEHITKAAVELFNDLGIKADPAQIDRLLKQDTGFPKDFELAILRDHIRRAGETVPLISSERALKMAKEIFEKYDPEASSIDTNRAIEIINFSRDRHRINVHLKIPVIDERGTIEVLVPVTADLYSVNPVHGTAEQLRGQKRIIEIQSGTYLNIESLKSEFFNRLDIKHYTVVVRSDDIKAREIISAASEYGIETVLLMNTSQPRVATDVSPTYFANMPDKKRVNQFWDKLVDSKQPSQDIRLEFKTPLITSYAEIYKQIEMARQASIQQLQTTIITNGIGAVNLNEFASRFGKDKTPIYLSGASEEQWENLAIKEQNAIRKRIERTLDGLDPKKVLILTSGLDSGVSKIIINSARMKGLDVLGVLNENSIQAELGSLTHASIVSRDELGKAAPLMRLLKERGGVSIYFSGDVITKNEIQYSQNYGSEFLLYKSAPGAAQNLAKENYRNGFGDSDELIGSLFKLNPNFIKAQYQLSARDSLFEKKVREIRNLGTRNLSYKAAVDESRSQKVVLINGYVGLGYEHPDKVKAAIRELMIREGDGVVYVSVGTHDGIGYVYDWIPEIAKSLNYKNVTTGAIKSKNEAASPLAATNWVHFVETDVKEWRPTLNGKDVQVQFLKDTGGKLVAFQGGELTGRVIQEALESQLPVEIVSGESFGPDPRRVGQARSVRLDTITDGTARFVKNKKNYPSLSVISRFEIKNMCRQFYLKKKLK